MTGSNTLLVCWWVALRVITSPSLLQVTVVAGPPVEVQVRVLDWLSYCRPAILGEPERDGKLVTETLGLVTLQDPS